MKRIILAIILNSITAAACFAQKDIAAKKYEAGNAQLKAGNATAALENYRAAQVADPDDELIDVQLAYTSLLLKNKADAEKYAEAAQMKNPAEARAALVKGVLLYTDGHEADAEPYLQEAVWLMPDESSFHANTAVLNDVHVKAVLSKSEALKAKLEELFKERDQSFVPISAKLKSFLASLEAGNTDDAAKSANYAVQLFRIVPAEYQGLGSVVGVTSAIKLSDKKEFKFSQSLVQNAFSNIPVRFPYIKALCAMQLMDFYGSEGRFSEALSIAYGMETTLQNLPAFAATVKGNILYFACNAASASGRLDELGSYARQMENIKGTASDGFYAANANNFLGNMYLQSTSGASRKLAAEYYEKALAIAKAEKLTDLQNSIVSNVALSYWQTGDKQKAKDTYTKVIADFEAAKNYFGEETAINNLGSLYYAGGDYATAAQYFQQAVDITEQQRNAYSGSEKLRFMESRVGAYKFLVSALYAAHNEPKIFSVLNHERSRQLTEQLTGTPTAPVSLQQFQALLAPEEAALFYSMLDGGTVLIQAVTKDGAVTVRSENFGLWNREKSKYLDRIHADKQGYKPASGIYNDEAGNMLADADIKRSVSSEDFDEMAELLREVIDEPGEKLDDVTDDLLRSYYSFLIDPVSADIGSKKKLVIFSDGILNFLPFAAFKSNDGKYLVENYDLRFSTSADVMNILRSRKYSASRKPLLAMGGAEFAEMSEKSAPPKDAEDWVRLRTQMELQIDQSRSMRPFFATLGFGKLNYLPGSLAEVQNLGRIVPNAQIVTGKEMTENLVKQMSADGRLKNFKYIHFSTHGYALSDFPEMSGIAMSIFAQPVGNEDGYLTAHEIANLKMNADLVYLSACETALGRIYGGEGVIGLSGALLRAGANNAVITLWPVSDAASVSMATGIYTGLTANAGSADVLLNEMQRKFIRGDFGESFRRPNIWAPFIHLGE